MRGNVQLLGLDRLQARLRALQLRIERKSYLYTLADAILRLVDPVLHANTPRKTGALEATTQAHIEEVGGQVAIIWSSEAAYADFVIHGTGVFHSPDAHSAWEVYGLQIFELDGQLVAAMHTHHEGQHAQNYPRATIEQTKPEIAAAIRLQGKYILLGYR